MNGAQGLVHTSARAIMCTALDIPFFLKGRPKLQNPSYHCEISKVMATGNLNLQNQVYQNRLLIPNLHLGCQRILSRNWIETLEVYTTQPQIPYCCYSTSTIHHTPPPFIHNTAEGFTLPKVIGEEAEFGVMPSFVNIVAICQEKEASIARLVTYAP